MTFEERLHRVLFEGWEDLGIEDPDMKSNFSYTDAEISEKAPRKYGMSYDDNKDKWNAMRFHPLYIEQVRYGLSRAIDQIHRIKNKLPKEKINFHELPQILDNIIDVGREIASDIGWSDLNDIVISIQQHPLVSQLLKIRDSLKV